MTEQTPEDRRDGPASGGSWGDHSSDATQVVRPPAGGYDQPAAVAAAPHAPPPQSAASHYPTPVRDESAAPFAAPMPTVGNPPVGAPISGSDASTTAEAGGWSPTAYAGQPSYGSQPAMTSVYPPSTPGYAPAGYPAAYAPPAAVPPPSSTVLVLTTSSRVGPGFLAALIGLLLSAGGVYLAAKFGVAAAEDFGQQKTVIKDSGLAALGAVLLLGAVGLNGWSPWATIIPGVALTVMGGWTLFSTSGATRFADWTKSVFSVGQLSTWNIVGFSLVLGLVMLGASVAATMARASGKKDGRIIGVRQTQI
ncbi:hypothetical protein [Nakamurella sp. PAMC28650]|uniref:hypothetical protein n=1 Tax=Nakamurella sp. PAMC28650 TaxID=2762325 RepID=UPI00164DAF58|nr:hypothetical protein [Nakamurella sp. PAMC28650]QNK80541.1 hypothetical protein H7F38_20670 [Nakamurella sp. PAMC28650]